MKLDVGYISELARLELTEDEKSLFQAQLDNIVGYMDKINSVNVDGVEPMMHGMTLVTVMREDEIQPSMEREEALANAPKRVGDEFLLPKIVEGAES